MRDSPVLAVSGILAEAIRQNPMEPMYYATLARAELRNSPPDGDVVRRGYDAALKINPNDVRMHLEYARALAGFGDTPGAYAHFQEAKRYNQLLNSDEAKRLPGGAGRRGMAGYCRPYSTQSSPAHS